MIETYVSIGKVTDYAIGVLKYFATASSILLISIIGALMAWIFLSAVGMIVAIVGIVIATIVLTLGIYELHTQKRRRR
jgi:CHASE2 domain-containing sensor protein